MSKEVDDFFDEIETEIPEEISRLVEKQMDIAEAIAAAIEKSKFKSQKEFAAAIGMKPSMLSRILSGNVNLTLKTIIKIESVLGTEIVSVGQQKPVQDIQYFVLPESINKFSQFIVAEPSAPYPLNNRRIHSGEIFINGSMPKYSSIKKGMYEARA